MKNTIFSIAATIGLALLSTFSNAQTIQWASLQPQQKHILNLRTGVEYGLIFGAGYSYVLNTKMPITLNAEYSFPSGKNLTDDFKSKIGGQIRLLQLGDFHFSAKIQGVFRRYQNSYVRLLNFGSDMSANIGYYKPKWFVAGEVGFDKAIVTHFKHSSGYRENYPGVVDGWYEPATGGNFYYGIQSGFSFKKQDVYLKAGKLLTQDFKTTPFLPFYAELGVNRRF